MESIIAKTKNIECVFCETAISSDNPICKKCGAEMTSEGIESLAVLAEKSIEAKDKATALLKHAFEIVIYAISIPVFGYIFGEVFYWLYIFYVVSSILFFRSLVNWNKNYTDSILISDDFIEANDQQKNAVLVFVTSVIVVLTAIFFNK
jgi:RNA polymerase subunit RPABC4/transcription elongation factor Spt4